MPALKPTSSSEQSYEVKLKALGFTELSLYARIVPSVIYVLTYLILLIASGCGAVLDPFYK